MGVHHILINDILSLNQIRPTFRRFHRINCYEHCQKQLKVRKKIIFMNDKELKLQIDNLVLLIEVEEENYKKALQSPTEFVILQRLKENLDKLKSDLQVFVDKQSVKKTGELPDESKSTGQ